MQHLWQVGRFQLDLSEAKIMGVLNCTPDSFSDGGQFVSPERAITRAKQMIAEGADIIDIGAESTRPGAEEISIDEELHRLIPVVKALVEDGQVPISIDSKKTAVMQAMLDLGVDMINDVHGFEDEDAFESLVKSDCALCIMHMRGMPKNMQNDTNYTDVVSEVNTYLQSRVMLAERTGISSQRIVVDPGFGFGKTPAQNMALIKHIATCVPSQPKLIGVSRKSTISHYLGNVAVNERLHGSVTLAALGIWCGASIVRVHDVRETKEAIRIVHALQRS